MRMIFRTVFFVAVFFAGTVAQSEPIHCEDHAAIVDGVPLDSSVYEILTRNAQPISADVYGFAPINGGRYWIRADYGDGANPTPYPHIGCFADIRIGIAWACTADREFVKRRFGCNWRVQYKSFDLPNDGCVTMPVALREPIMYCAPGASPTVK